MKQNEIHDAYQTQMMLGIMLGTDEKEYEEMVKRWRKQADLEDENGN